MRAKKLILISTLILFSLNTFGQSDSLYKEKKAYFLFSAGHKTSYSFLSLFTVGQEIIPSLSIEVGPSLHFIYGSSGFKSGINYNLTRDRKFQAILHLDYRFLFSSKINLRYEEDKKSVVFKNPPTNHFYGGVSLGFLIDDNSQISIITTYGIPAMKYRTKYIDGDYSSEIEGIINNRLKEGWGFAIVLTQEIGSIF